MQSQTKWKTCANPPLRRVAGLATAAGVSLYLAAAPPAAQQRPPTKEELAKDNKLFLTLARQTLKWDIATEPSKIVGPLHHVATAGLSSYLFATREGHILFNTGMPESGPMIVASIQKLGFDAKDIKIMIRARGTPTMPERSPTSRN